MLRKHFPDKSQTVYGINTCASFSGGTSQTPFSKPFYRYFLPINPAPGEICLSQAPALRLCSSRRHSPDVSGIICMPRSRLNWSGWSIAVWRSPCFICRRLKAGHICIAFHFHRLGSGDDKGRRAHCTNPRLTKGEVANDLHTEKARIRPTQGAASGVIIALHQRSEPMPVSARCAASLTGTGSHPGVTSSPLWQSQAYIKI